MLQVTITVLDDGKVKYDENITGRCMVSHFGLLYQAMMSHAAELLAVCAANITQNKMPLPVCQADLVAGMSEYALSRKARMDEEMAKLQKLAEEAKAQNTNASDVSQQESSDPNGGNSQLPVEELPR